MIFLKFKITRKCKCQMKLQRSQVFNRIFRHIWPLGSAAAHFHLLHAKSVLHLVLEILRTISTKQSIRSICPQLLKHEQACLQDVFVLRVSKHDYKFYPFPRLIWVITPSIKLINLHCLCLIQVTFIYIGL